MDVNEESVQAAESLGMTAVKITDISEAQLLIERFTGIKVMNIYQRVFHLNRSDLFLISNMVSSSECFIRFFSSFFVTVLLFCAVNLIK